MLLRLILIVFFTFLSGSIDASEAHFQVCKNQYALCTSARCIPNPDDPNHKSICKCDIEKGVNIGMTSCDKRVPKQVNGVTTLLSTFSFEQLPKLKVMTCVQKHAWSNCLDYPCTVDPQNPSKAMCSCQLENSADFVTVGGNCKTASCAGGYWSGATKTSSFAASQSLAKYLKQPNVFMNSLCKP